ncbi:MAG: SSU ribosomal protein S8p (S15Ae), partial [uncultured Thermomicrobiales bacterium]
ERQRPDQRHADADPQRRDGAEAGDDDALDQDPGRDRPDPEGRGLHWRLPGHRAGAPEQADRGAALWSRQAPLDPRDQAGEQAGPSRLREQGPPAAGAEWPRDRRRDHPAGGDDRLRGAQARHRRRGALHRLV